jgi:hypothetical protein
MTRSRKVGSRRRRAALAGAIAAVAATALGVGSASAATQNLNVPFDDAALTLPTIGTSDVLDSAASIAGTNVIEDSTGDITAATLTFPDFTGTASGVPVKVQFHSNAPLNGNLGLTGPTTGVMNFPNAAATIAYTAVVQLNPPSGAVCTYSPVPLKFSTTGGSPIAGVPFTVASGPPISTTHGILQATWTAGTFPASGGPGCTLIDGLTSGAGQLALGNGFDLTPPVPATPAGGGTVPPPLKKKCKKAKKKHSAQSAKKKGCKKKKK